MFFYFFQTIFSLFYARREVLLPYIAITMKHINGSTNDTFTAGRPAISPLSIIIACRGGSTEPPSIAIIRPAAPNFASSPNPLRAIPYMVGNISDIQPETATSE